MNFLEPRVRFAVSSSSSSRRRLSAGAVALAWGTLAGAAPAATLSNGTFSLQTGSNGEISSFQIVGDTFATNYVLNASNAPGQDTADHEWLGELMFSYRMGSGAWQTALSQASGDARTITTSASSVTVSYQNSASAAGIKHFKVVETYALVDNYVSWQIALTNTSAQSIEFGDVGLPLTFNEYWNQANDLIYETRVVYHSFTSQNGSYVTIKRPSGVGPFLLMTPDSSTGAGFEYMDNWVMEEHANSAWAAGGGTPTWPNGLDVFYIHSNQIKKTNRGYLPNTSLTLAAGASKTYAFRFFKVADQSEVQRTLYSEGLIDITVVPSLMFASDMTAKIDLHTSKPINSVTPQYPAETTLTPLGMTGDHHDLYALNLAHLGQNNVVISYGSGQTSTLQFYVLEPLEAALKRHATFLVASTVPSAGSLHNVFDDWMMDTKAQRGATGGSGWGDDWGWTKGQFLAEKNAQTPVASEVQAVDDYLDAIWANALDHTSYIVQDWWCPAGTSAANPMNCFYNRPYAYPHAFNTYFSMYKIASLYPTLVSYHNSAETYLLRAYGILHSLYSGGPPPPKAPATIAGTGYMGEQTLPEIMHALTAGGHTGEAAFVKTTIDNLHTAFNGSPYPYGSEYKYDNTGEEAVYMAAKENADQAILSKVNAKTRACRGQEPVWYYYSDPVTLNGENWWQFQYTAALVGYCMDDWLRNYSATPEVDERLSYAAKIANVSAINSGQIDSNPANLGTVSWTYQAMKGNVYRNSFDPPTSALHNGWRQMAGEADLGLFGAIRVLSSDVAVDPIFGLYGYGCDVTASNGCYSVTPRDGVFKRLNLITEELHLELDRDRYLGATVSSAKNYLGFTLQNQTGDAHTTHLTLSGFAAGTYDVTVAGGAAPPLTVTAGQPAVVALSIGAGATAAVVIGNASSTCQGTSGAAPGGGGGLGAGGASSGGGATSSGGGSSGGAGPGAGGAAVGSGGTGPGVGPGQTTGSNGSTPSGCGCHVGASESKRDASWLTWFGLIAASARRRRRESSAGRPRNQKLTGSAGRDRWFGGPR